MKEVSLRNEIYLDLESHFDRLRSNSAIAALLSEVGGEQFGKLAGMVSTRATPMPPRPPALFVVKTGNT